MFVLYQLDGMNVGACCLRVARLKAYFETVPPHPDDEERPMAYRDPTLNWEPPRTAQAKLVSSQRPKGH